MTGRTILIMKQPNALRKMSLIVAVDSKYGIGKNNALPWMLRKDMKFFVENTTKTTDPAKVNAVIMGRKCWESIPKKFRPLKDRLNVVITRTLPEYRDDNLIISQNFDEIVNELISGTLSEKVEKVWNIGGGEIYRMALEKDYVKELLVTKIQKDFDADIFLTGVEWDRFQEDESARSELMTENGLDFTFHRYCYVE
ncbi:dihydrofolate reductase [Teladorsagia circumcincta]|uniref:dihydrofolate reductase n=1 Tax=Teladorsagia circumcincta TaxID=45464 RepID=A0A2G9UXN6_TELCI|nr:dihydrofolate reductase [Teladorsagia circumcincta]